MNYDTALTRAILHSTRTLLTEGVIYTLSLYRDEDVKNKDKRFFFANKLICFLNVSDFTCSLDYVKGLKMQKR